MKRIARSMGAAVLATLLLAVGAVPGFGKPIIDEDYGDAVLGAVKGGTIVTAETGRRGWRSPGFDDDNVKGYIEYDLERFTLNASQGTMEFRVSRDDLSKGPNEGQETLFSLNDASGERLFVLRVYWNGYMSSQGPTFRIATPALPGANRWYNTATDLTYRGSVDEVNYLPFPSPVAKGQTVHIAVTWGPGANNLYVDGVRVPASYREPFVLPTALAQARTLLVGAETSRSRSPNGAWSMTHSVIDSFRVHDRVLDPSEFGVSGSAIAQLTHDASSVAGFSGSLVEGDELTATLTGTPGAAASFDIGQRPDSRGELPLDWRGYYDEDVNTIDLEDVTHYRVYTSPVYFTLEDVARFQFAQDNRKYDLGAGVYQGITEVEELRARDMIQQHTITGLDADLTIFVMVTAVNDRSSTAVSFTDADGATVTGSVDLEEGIILPIGGVAMTESADVPGSYQGTLAIAGDVSFATAVLVGRLANGGGAVVVESGETFAIDTAVRILVKTSPSLLKADEKSTSRLTVEVRNANGDTVSGHGIALSLATTSEYTGVIGGGKLADAMGGALALDFSGETDAFGTVQATFTAGFAAKTAIIVARDLRTNDVGSGFVQQYIEGTTDIELVGLRPSAAKAAGYSISVSSDKEWLTADGSSQAKITAQVLQNGGPVAGHTVVFSVVGEGRIKTVNAVTDATGSARAVYTAGTKIGLVLVKATDVTIGLSGSVQIELRSDAPAKIAFEVKVLDPIDAADSTGKGLPELYADGRSRADLTVLITDINDNPNKDTTVTYAMAAGSGTLEQVKSVTDQDGKSYATFKAGQLPGTATIKVTVASNVPSAADKGAAENAVLTVPDFEFITE